MQLQSGIRTDFRQLQLSEKTKEFNDYTYSLGGTYNLSRYVFRANLAKGFRAPNLIQINESIGARQIYGVDALLCLQQINNNGTIEQNPRIKTHF